MAIVNPYDDVIITVYRTEADALSGTRSNALQYNKTTGEVSREVSSASDPGYDYFIFKEFWYRVEFNEPVRGFYIDWDDGDDNSPERANSQVVKFDEPRFFGVVSHIYTKNDEFYPLVRAISDSGFWSKYYTSGQSDNDFTVIEEVLPNVGSQDVSNVHRDTTDTINSAVRIPYFVPANLPPIGVLKTDRKGIFAGIDNSQLALTGSTVTVTCTDTSRTTDILVIFEDVDGTTREIKKTHAGTFIAKKILSVRLLNLKETTSASSVVPANLDKDDRIYITVGSPAVAICNVSLGNPLVTIGRPGFSAILDASESRTRASNVNIKSLNSPVLGMTDGANGYYFDDGRLTSVQTSSTTQVADTFAAGQGQGKPRLRISYTFEKGVSSNDIRTDYQDTNYRFHPSEKLVRCQVIDNHNDNITDASFADDTFSTSFVEHWRRNQYDDVSLTAKVPTELQTEGLLMLYDEDRNCSYSTTGVVFNSAKTITKSGGDLDTRGFVKGGKINVTGSTSNNNTFTIANVTDTVITVVEAVVTEGATSATIVQDGWIECGGNNGNHTNSLLGRTTATWVTTSGSTYSGMDRQPFFLNTGNDVRTVGGYGGANDSYTIDTTSDGWQSGTTADSTPQFLLMVKERKFNRLYIAVDNLLESPVITGASGATAPEIEIALRYVYKDSNGKYNWKSLPFVNNTRINTSGNSEGAQVRTSFYKSGTISFDMPEDWEKVKADATVASTWATDADAVAGGWDQRPPRDITGSSIDPNALWDFEGYGLIMDIRVDNYDGTTATNLATKMSVNHITPFDNSHSQIIMIEDPHHISLNSVAISQSISFNRKGKFMKIEDRMGRAEIRRIGVAGGGRIKFGGIQLAGDFSTSYGNIRDYQRDGTPVFLDLTKENSEFIRIYGKIVSMSEDYPTGKQKPKYGVEMQMSHIIECNSDGTWMKANGRYNLLGLGGVIEDEPEYLL